MNYNKDFFFYQKNRKIEDVKNWFLDVRRHCFSTYKNLFVIKTIKSGSIINQCFTVTGWEIVFPFI